MQPEAWAIACLLEFLPMLNLIIDKIYMDLNRTF